MPHAGAASFRLTGVEIWRFRDEDADIRARESPRTSSARLGPRVRPNPGRSTATVVAGGARARAIGSQ